MSLEIERKFLLKPGAALPDSDQVLHIRQCYLNNDSTLSVRIRIIGEDEAFLTIKKATQETLAIRSEYEYAIPIDDAIELMNLAIYPPIVKHRHIIMVEGVKWEVDFFSNENEGLILAEIELESLEDAITLPDWIGKEVSQDPRYMNHQLSRHPYTTWVTEEK